MKPEHTIALEDLDRAIELVRDAVESYESERYPFHTIVEEYRWEALEAAAAKVREIVEVMA